MATLAEKLDAWESGTLSQDGEQTLIDRVLRGTLDGMGGAEGIDMPALKEYMASKGAKTVIRSKEELETLSPDIQAELTKDKGFTGLAEDVVRTGLAGGVGIVEGAQDIGETLSKTGEETAAETTAGLVSGGAEIIGGGLEVAFAPITEAIERVPVANTLMEKFAEGVGAASEFLGDKIGTNEEEKEVLTQSFNNLFNLAIVEAGGSKTVQRGIVKGVEVAKPLAQKTLEVSKQMAIDKGTGFTNWTKTTLESVKDTAARSKAEKAIKSNLEGLNAIESSNSVMRKNIANAKSKGVDVKQIVAETDLLKNSINKEGAIRTTKDGGAVEQINDVFNPYEGAISRVLEQEGRSLGLDVIESTLLDTIKDSTLKGANKTAAMKKVKSEIEGLRLDVNELGELPLSEIQKAKVDKYKNLDYSNSASKSADKAIARAYKDLIEKYTESADVRAINAELTKFYTIREFLEKLDGRTVKGGRLSKYFNQTIGAVIGSQFGPLGALAGAEVAKLLTGKAMKSKFGKTTGSTIEPAEVIKNIEDVSN